MIRSACEDRRAVPRLVAIAALGICGTNISDIRGTVVDAPVVQSGAAGHDRGGLRYVADKNFSQTPDLSYLTIDFHYLLFDLQMKVNAGGSTHR